MQAVARLTQLKQARKPYVIGLLVCCSGCWPKSVKQAGKESWAAWMLSQELLLRRV
jgi:hypothetical protein